MEPKDSKEDTASGSPSSPSEMPKNPLMHFVVLQVLFKHIWNDLPSLKNALLVCKTWKDAGENARKSVAVPVTIVQDDRMPAYPMKGAIKLSEFLQQLSNPNRPTIPQANFTLANWKILKNHISPDNGAASNADMNKRFWNSFGKSIRILTLSGCKVDFTNNQSVEEFFRAVFPNVEKLTLKNCRLKRTREEEVALSRINRSYLRDVLYNDGFFLPPLNLNSLPNIFDEVRFRSLHFMRNFPNARSQEMDRLENHRTKVRRLRRQRTRFLRESNPLENRVPRENQNVHYPTWIGFR